MLDNLNSFKKVYPLALNGVVRFRLKSVEILAEDIPKASLAELVPLRCLLRRPPRFPSEANPRALAAAAAKAAVGCYYPPLFTLFPACLPKRPLLQKGAAAA